LGKDGPTGQAKKRGGNGKEDGTKGISANMHKKLCSKGNPVSIVGKREG